MRNLLVEIAYNGAHYHGYQVQKNALTVTQVVQDAVEAVLHRREDIVGCSRTDSGVHARSYFFNLKTEVNIPTEKFMQVMNRKLPEDIAVLCCKEVPMGFHARYDCKGKEYVYRIHNSPKKDPFTAELAWHVPYPLDEKKLHEAAQCLVGTHDFSAFCTVSRAKEGSKVRTVEYVNLRREGDEIILHIKADGFLYHMVRIIVGTLVAIGTGKIPAKALPEILESMDRSRAGKTAPPQGLYLNRVEY